MSPRAAQPEGKPTKPLTGYMQFSKDHQEQFKDKPVTERSKLIGELWKKLPKDQQDVYSKAAREAMEKYKKDLAAWYEEHPDDKKRDEDTAAAKKSKRGAKKGEDERPRAKLNISEKSAVRIMFFVAHIKRYHAKHPTEYLPCTPRVKNKISTQLKGLSEADHKTWTDAWNGLEDDYKRQLKAFYESWLATEAKPAGSRAKKQAKKEVDAEDAEAAEAAADADAEGEGDAEGDAADDEVDAEAEAEGDGDSGAGEEED